MRKLAQLVQCNGDPKHCKRTDKANKNSTAPTLLVLTSLRAVSEVFPQRFVFIECSSSRPALICLEVRSTEKFFAVSMVLLSPLTAFRVVSNGLCAP